MWRKSSCEEKHNMLTAKIWSEFQAWPHIGKSTFSLSVQSIISWFCDRNLVETSQQIVFFCFHPFLECIQMFTLAWSRFYGGKRVYLTRQKCCTLVLYHLLCLSQVFAHTVPWKRRSWITPTFVVTHVRLPTPPLDTIYHVRGRVYVLHMKTFISKLLN